MTFRQKDLIETQIYEENLKLHLDTKKNTLDVILRVSMPLQLNTMKTILWINIVLIGILLSFSKVFGFDSLAMLSISLYFLSIILIIFAFTQKRYKYYGDINDIDYMYSLNYKSKFAKQNGIINVMLFIDNAIQKNKDIMNYLALLVHLAVISTFFGIVSHCLYIGLEFYNKEILWQNKNHQTIALKYQSQKDHYTNQMKEVIYLKRKNN